MSHRVISVIIRMLVIIIMVVEVIMMIAVMIGINMIVMRVVASYLLMQYYIM